MQEVPIVRIWAERDFQKIGETFTNKALASFAGGCFSEASFRRRCKWQTSLILAVKFFEERRLFGYFLVFSKSDINEE